MAKLSNQDSDRYLNYGSGYEMDKLIEPKEGYGLKRIKGTCCPDPECDRENNPSVCFECGHCCADCQRGKAD